MKWSTNTTTWEPGVSWRHFKTLDEARACAAANGLRFDRPGDRFSFDLPHLGLGVRCRVEADPDGRGLDSEPGVDYVGVIVEVGARVEVRGKGWSKRRFVVLGDSSLWGIDDLDTPIRYGFDVVQEQLDEAMAEVNLVIDEVRALPREDATKERAS